MRSSTYEVKSRIEETGLYTSYSTLYIATDSQGGEQLLPCLIYSLTITDLVY